MEKEHAVGYHPKPDNRIWFDDDRKTAVEEKNMSCKKWIDTLTSCRRLEYERLQKIAHKICKNEKGIQTDNCIKKILKKSMLGIHTNLCKGTNDDIILNEEDQNSWKTYFQDLLK